MQIIKRHTPSPLKMNDKQMPLPLNGGMCPRALAWQEEQLGKWGTGGVSGPTHHLIATSSSLTIIIKNPEEKWRLRRDINNSGDSRSFFLIFLNSI